MFAHAIWIPFSKARGQTTLLLFHNKKNPFTVSISTVKGFLIIWKGVFRRPFVFSIAEHFFEECFQGCVRQAAAFENEPIELTCGKQDLNGHVFVGRGHDDRCCAPCISKSRDQLATSHDGHVVVGEKK